MKKGIKNDRMYQDKYLEDPSVYDMFDEKTPAETIGVLQELVKKYRGRNLLFKVDYQPDGTYINMVDRVWETDAELKARQDEFKNRGKLAKQRKEAEELAVYNRLHKKFGGMKVDAPKPADICVTMLGDGQYKLVGWTDKGIDFVGNNAPSIINSKRYSEIKKLIDKKQLRAIYQG